MSIITRTHQSQQHINKQNIYKKHLLPHRSLEFVLIYCEFALLVVKKDKKHKYKFVSQFQQKIPSPEFSPPLLGEKSMWVR